jgi:hypothetical protein
MQSALHITTKVLPGNRVEVQLPYGSEGQNVDVFIVLAVTPLSGAEYSAQLSKMAEDEDIQAELTTINAEFSTTEMDGLGVE